MHFFRKIFLTLAIAFVVLCYGYPMFILPFGSYKYNYKVGDQTKTVELQFKWDGSYKLDDSTGFYKLKGNKIYLNDTKDFGNLDDKTYMIISNMYNVKFSMPIGESADVSVQFSNKIGEYVAIGIGVVSLLLVLSIPNRRRD